MKLNAPAFRSHDKNSNGVFSPLRFAAERIWASRWYEPVLLLFSVVVLLLSAPYVGCILTVLCACFMLVFCTDILSALMPLLMTCIMSTGFYSEFGSVLDYLPVLALLVISVAAHFIIYPSPIRFGEMTKPLIAISVSTILGGIGRIAVPEYFSIVSLYYIIGLGVFMLASYVLLYSRPEAERSYNVTARFIKTVYLAGICIGSAIFIEYLHRLDEFLDIGSSIYISYRNYAATVMLAAMPCVCVNGRRLCPIVCGILFLYLAMLFTGSRTALFFGTAEALACAAWTVLSVKREKRKLAILIGILAVLALAVTIKMLAEMLFRSRLVDGEMISQRDSRYVFYATGIKDFLAAPIFGWGLGNMKNRHIFYGVDGSLVWYHDIVIQYMASLGAVGIVSFVWMWCRRLRLLFRKKVEMRFAVSMSWLGMILASLTNPGEACPIPNAFIMLALFIIVEKMPDKDEKRVGLHS